MAEHGLVCYVVMPFGTKPDGMGGTIDFDLVFQAVIAPAVHAAGMKPVRADNLATSGLIHEANLRWVIGAAVTVFDVTTSNPNVLYELGIRHALKPRTTMLIAESRTSLPFDLHGVRVLRYALNAAGRPDTQDFQRRFAEIVQAVARDDSPDSPVYAIFNTLEPPNTANVAAGADRETALRDADVIRRIQDARRLGVDELKDVESEIGDVATLSSDVLLTLFDAYRSRSAWREMIELARRMSPAMTRSPKVQQQLALALNRAGEPERAEEVLQQLLKTAGPSSETYGLLGRVYKDRWDKARTAGETVKATGLLRKAIDSYLRGFETDWRDPYCGINAVTLMEMLDQIDLRRDELLPVVLYGVKRRLASQQHDYWDVATLFELRVLMRDEEGARSMLPDLLGEARDQWQSSSTARNLKFIREERERRGEASSWIAELERELQPTGESA